jgi:hypothetical protein
VVVAQSLDSELGAGALSCVAALQQFQPDELNDSHTNTAQNRVFDTPLHTPTLSGNTVINGKFWDLERVQGATSPTDTNLPGTVDYLLGNIVGGHLRATLTWDNVGGALEPLEMRLYHEGSDPGNLPGFDPNNRNADTLLAETDLVGENVKLFDFTVPDYANRGTTGDYLEVYNSQGTPTDYAIAVSVPEPSLVLIWVAGLGILGTRRRRR